MATTSTIPPTRTDLIALARATAEAHQLDAALVCAICEQESAWNPWAIRYEPAFFAHYVAPQLAAGQISNTEAQARAFSWGLMQVMGQVAREHNFGAASASSTRATRATLRSRDGTGNRMCSLRRKIGGRARRRNSRPANMEWWRESELRGGSFSAGGAIPATADCLTDTTISGSGSACVARVPRRGASSRN